MNIKTNTKTNTKPSELDQQTRGLQDDHDPNDLGQQQANHTGGVSYRSGEKRDPKNPKRHE
jgi:hypothetical protein